MKTYLARAAIASALLLGASIAEAQYSRRSMEGFDQNESLVVANYEISAPVGDLKNFISNWGFRGFSIEGRYKLAKQISLGMSFSANRWQQTYDNLQVDLPNGNISGPVFRYTDMFGIRALAHY